MKKLLTCTAALLALSACARVDPIDLNEVDDVEPVAPADLVNETDDLPAIASNLVWQVDGQTALFGAAEGGALLGFTCEDGSLEVRRFADGSSGAGTLTFGTGTALASIAVAAEGGEDETQRYRATLAPGDIGDDLIAVFAANTPVDVTMTGVDPLIVPGDAAVGELLSACLERGAEDGEAAEPQGEAAATTDS